MTTVVFDTLQLSEQLKAAGLPPEQAEAVVRAIARAQEGLVTKADLEIALAPLKTDLTVLKWMLGLLLAMAASVVVKAFFPMILTTGGIKGGSGKTTLATHFAILRARQGREVLLVDADDQETAADFSLLRNERHPDRAQYTSIRLAGLAVRTEVKRLAPKYDDIIIDTGGRDTTSQRAALSIADFLLVPFVPRSFDLWTIEKVSQLVDELRLANPALRAATCLNRTDPRGSDNEAAAEVLQESALVFLEAPLGTRKAFANAAAQGLAVTELVPPDAKASAELVTLFRQVFDG